MLDIATIAMCSTASAAILCIAMLVSWLKDGRPRNSFWLFAPFAIAIPAGVLLSYPERFGGSLALAIGWFLLTLVYGAAWQSARFVARRKPRPLIALIACIASLAFSLSFGSDGAYAEWRMLPRTLLMAAFCLLAAREYHAMRDRHLPSAHALAWLFLIFGIFHAVRSPLSLLLPAPFGPGEPQVWTIALFNFQLVLHGLLIGILMTTLGRERIAMHHYHLAMVDPLTGVGNRRALDRRLAEILSGRDTGKDKDAEARYALAIIDIDRFKAVNDRFGHGFGDIVIAGAANIACETVGHRNVFRLGGEEFAVLLQVGDNASAFTIAEKIRGQFAARAHIAHGISHRATLSAGVALLDADNQPADIFKEADRALYLAKAMGRNRTVLADEETLARLMEEALDDMVPARSQATAKLVPIDANKRSLRRA